jgi:CRISPR-associated protein Csb1
MRGGRMMTLTLETLLQPNGPTCLIVKANLEPVGGIARFQPAGFPEVGHVLYDAPWGKNGTKKVCIIDSPASMANHLEAACMAGQNRTDLHPDIDGLPYVICATDRNYKQEQDQLVLNPQDPHDKVVVTSLTEGHRIASDYFLDALVDPQWKEEERKKVRRKGDKEQENVVPAHWEGLIFRDKLRKEFGITEVKKDKTYFVHPEDWWTIYQTIFSYDPNSLIHGVMFAREQIKINRFLTAHLEAFGATRVGRSGVKFDRLGKTTSGQPIFAVDEETAHEIWATFILDLALLRSYGRDKDKRGINEADKRLLLELAFWKIQRLLGQPYRYRTQCHLTCSHVEIRTEKGLVAESLLDLNVKQCIENCQFGTEPMTRVYYPANELFKQGRDVGEGAEGTPDEAGDEGTEEE